MSTTEMNLQSFELEIRIEAPRARVWQSLIDEISEWWPTDFYCGAQDGDSAKRFVIEPKLGGRMYEDWGDGQGLVWGNVIGLRTADLLELIGDSSPAFGGPSRNHTSFRLADDGQATLLRFSESCFGVCTDKTKGDLEGGWQMLLDALKSYAESE